MSTTTIDTLRFATAGSVDDGKSTLVGRLLHDSKSVLTDQLEAVERVSASRGQEGPDLALLTDGLRAEREQGITIDVAYRYFATPRRRFILADTPGHVQYTRNMVTGASTAELTVILVDARNGVVEQTRRHAAIAALLRVPHVVLAVNKMDLVAYEEQVFARIAEEFTAYASELGVPEITAIPISALAGDNVVEPSAHMDWYGGPTVLEHLESVPVSHDLAHCHARLPVQYVIRPQTAEHPDYRGYAGQIAAGTFRVGDPVTVLPSGRATKVAGIDVLGKPVESGTSENSRLTQLQSTLDLYQNLYINLLSSLESVRLARLQNTPNIVQIEPAAVPDQPIRPRPLMNTALAAAVGLMLAAGVVFLVEYLDVEADAVRASLTQALQAKGFDAPVASDVGGESQLTFARADGASVIAKITVGRDKPRAENAKGTLHLVWNAD